MDPVTLTSTTSSDPIERISQLLEREEHRAAWAEMSRLILTKPTSANCHAVAGLASKVSAKSSDLVPLRVAVLSNFTADSLGPILTARALPSRLLLDVWVAGYDLWSQEVLDPASQLRAHAPDVVILALELETLAPALGVDFLEFGQDEITHQIEDAAERIRETLQALRSWSKARVLIHSFPLPTRPALGIYDPMASQGQTAAIGMLNERLRETARSIDNCAIVDVDRIIATVGDAHWRDRRMAMLAKMPVSIAALHALADEHLRYIRAFTGVLRKVLVVDLDNTLWGGILGEDGPDGIQLGEGYPGNAYVDLQKAILSLYRRGVVLAINSKNNQEDVDQLLRSHPSMVLRPEHFAAMRINWQDKLTNMLELSEELGLGIESFVFIDDSDAECERLRQALPEVLTIQLSGEPAMRADTLRGLGVFDTLSYSEEDRERGAFYRREVQRTQLRKSMQSLEDFYRSLEMELFIEPVGDQNLGRAAELTQRTNQFNLTTHRFTRDELSQRVSSEGVEAYGFRLRDRFGDNGMIAFAILEPEGDALAIGTFLMSCRVLKRTVEDAVLAFLIERAAARGVPEIRGLYRPTKKNGVVADLYPTHGFAAAGESGDTRTFVRSTGDLLEYPSWIRVKRANEELIADE